MSETDFLKLKKHDNVETNTEKFDIENYLNGNWDKINENAKEVNTNISNINSKDTELEKELKEAQEDFYQNSIRGQASGEYIHVEDSSNCRARIGISGNSEQETRSGKNKLACPANFEETTFGIKVKQNNGIYSITGTTTSAGTCMTEKTIDNYTIESGDYLHLNNNVIENRVAFVFVFTDGTVDSTSLTEINRICNLENKVGKTISKVRIYCNTKDVNLSFEIKPMICKDSAVTDFERYGAMPSPDYPSEIKTVGSNMNLFDKDNANIIKAGFENNKLVTGDTRRTLYLKIKPNTNYIVSKIISTRFDIATTQDIPSNGLVVNNKISKPDSSNITIKSNNNDNYIIVYFYNTSADTVTEQEVLDSIKIEEGIVATPYSKYGQGCVKVTKCNKNLLDLTKKPYSESASTLNGAIVSINNGVLTVDATNSTGTTHIKSGWKPYTDNSTILIPKGTYYTSLLLNLTGVVSLVSKQVGGGIFTLEEDCYLTQWFFTVSQGNKMTKALQIEEGTTATPYEEHKSQTYTIPIQQPFRSVGNTRDTFIKKNNKWYERHYIPRKIFDGSDTDGWAYRSDDKLIATEMLKNIAIIPSSNYEKAQISCNYFIVEKRVGAEVKTGIIGINELGSLFIYNNYNSLTEFKAWLKEKYDEGNPMYVDYVSKAPTDIECTEEQSKILDELNNARTYKNVTNIYSTDEISPILSLDYAKDLETLLNNTQALAVNNASEGV